MRSGECQGATQGSAGSEASLPKKVLSSLSEHVFDHLSDAQADDAVSDQRDHRGATRQARQQPPGGFAINSLDEELLLAVIAKLRARYQVIYNRPRATDITIDHQEIHEAGDIEVVKLRFPDVLKMQEVHADNPDLTFNELQLRGSRTAKSSSRC
jgi:hypothetical protein